MCELPSSFDKPFQYDLAISFMILLYQYTNFALIGISGTACYVWCAYVIQQVAKMNTEHRVNITIHHPHGLQHTHIHEHIHADIH